MRPGREAAKLAPTSGKNRARIVVTEPFRISFRIDADHPALPGHFPGQPVVPGVVLLDRVAAAVAQWQRGTLRQLAQVKFLQPLLPDQDAELLLSADGERVRFRIRVAQREIASGILETDA